MKSCQLVLVEYVRSDMFPSIECMRNREVNSESRAPQRYDIANTKEYHGNAIRPFWTLGAIAERTYSDYEKECDIKLFVGLDCILSLSEEIGLTFKMTSKTFAPAPSLRKLNASLEVDVAEETNYVPLLRIYSRRVR